MERNNEMNTGASQQPDHKPTMPKVEGPATVLVVGSPDDASTDLILQCVRDAGHRCTCVPTLDGARKALQSGDTDLVLLDACLDTDALSLITESRTSCPWLRVIAWSHEADSDATIEAIRLGASDYLILPAALDELPGRIGQAISQGRSHRRREQKLQRLMEACNTLRASKDEMSEQVDVLCSDLASAYRTSRTRCRRSR